MPERFTNDQINTLRGINVSSKARFEELAKEWGRTPASVYSKWRVASGMRVKVDGKWRSAKPGQKSPPPSAKQSEYGFPGIKFVGTELVEKNLIKRMIRRTFSRREQELMTNLTIKVTKSLPKGIVGMHTAGSAERAAYDLCDTFELAMDGWSIYPYTKGNIIEEEK